MIDYLEKKGNVWYGKGRYRRIDLRGSLKTSDLEIAKDRLLERQLLIRDGKYQLYKKKFEDLILEFDPKGGENTKKNKFAYLKNHLIPAFRGKRLSEIDIQSWAEKIVSERVRSTALAILGTAVEMGFEINYENFNFKKGKKFDGTQILTEEMAVRTLDYLKASPRRKRYSGIFHVGMYSTMPLSDILHLTKAQVVFIGPDAGITYTRRKTRHLDRPNIFILMSDKLREAFKSIPVPLFPDDRWFPPMKTSTVSSAVGAALKACGWVHGGGMHVLRHFGACLLLKRGILLPTLRDIMGHSDFNTTLIYARTDREAVKEGMRKFDAI